MKQVMKEREKCDCDVQKLLDEYNAVGRHWAGLMKWNDTTWWLYCNQHRVYIAVELSATKQ